MTWNSSGNHTLSGALQYNYLLIVAFATALSESLGFNISVDDSSLSLQTINTHRANMVGKSFTGVPSQDSITISYSIWASVQGYGAYGFILVYYA